MTIREPVLETWSSAIDEFPVSGTPREKLEGLIPFAIRAPSSHNSQPWKFTVFSDHLELRADRTRRMPVVDPDDRELIISCGAALGYLEVALRNFGYAGAVELVPRDADPDLVARVALGEARDPTLMDRALFDAMAIRRTHRLPFLPRTPDADLLAALEAFGDQHGTWFRIIQPLSHRQALTDLVSEGDRLQMADPAFRQELTGWLHPNRSKSRDGMPGWTFGLNPLESVAMPLVVRTFDTGSGRAAIDRELAAGSPILAVLGTPTDTMHDWVQTGRVLSQILLRAAMEGVAASYLNQPIELPDMRIRVRALLGTSEYPQMILRMGFPRGEDRRTPRREPADVISRMP
jgi:nitroreductase